MSRVTASLSAAVSLLLLVACGADAPTPAGTLLPDPAEPATVARLIGPWRPVPLALDPATFAAIDRTCRASIGSSGAMGPGAAANLRPLVADARGGREVWVLYGAPGGDSADCEVEIGEDGSMTTAGIGTSSGADGPQPLAPVALEVTSSISTDDSARGPRSGVFGRIGAAINRVRVLLPDGVVAEASIANGTFAAWWPRPQGRFLVEAYDATGAKVAEARQ